MARKISKFPLVLRDGNSARTIEEVREFFDVEAIKEYFESGRLLKWLKDRNYEEEIEAVEELSGDEANLDQELCKIFGVSLEEIQSNNPSDKRLEKLKEYTDDPFILKKIDYVAFDEDEFDDLIDQDVPEIVIVDAAYRIPLRAKNTTYYGVGKAVAIIKKKDYVNFDDYGIKFINVKFNEEYQEIVDEYMAEHSAKTSKTENQKTEKLVAEKVMNKVADVPKKESVVSPLKPKNIIPKDVDNSIVLDENTDDDILMREAEKGNARALYYLGDKYDAKHWNEDGDIAKNYAMKAFHFYSLAADMGDSDAEYSLAVYYKLGVGGEEDINEAYNWALSAAKKENADAQHFLGKFYEEENGIGPSPTKAFYWYKKSAENGSIDGMYELYQCYLFGYGTAENDVAANEVLTKMISCGEDTLRDELNDDELVFIYTEYADWLYGQSDIKSAFEWYYKAADKLNHPRAQFMLGEIYSEDNGIGISPKTAFNWYNLSATNGYLKAWREVCYCYKNGVGTEKNEKNAFIALDHIVNTDTEELKKYFSEDEIIDASLLYAFDVYNGNGIKADIEVAYKLFNTLSTNYNNSTSQFMLGEYHRAGLGHLDVNMEKAVYWYTRAADNKKDPSPEACDALAAYYGEDEGFSIKNAAKGAAAGAVAGMGIFSIAGAIAGGIGAGVLGSNMRDEKKHKYYAKRAEDIRNGVI